MQTQKAILNTEEAAAFTGLSRGTLVTFRCRGKGPRFTRLGRSVRYKVADLEAYIEAGMVETADSLGAGHDPKKAARRRRRVERARGGVGVE